MKHYSIKNPPALPEGVPPLPSGYVYLGLGGSFDQTPSGIFNGGSVDGVWDIAKWAGDAYDRHYAAPEGSEIVTLNFGHPLGAWADRLPRPYVDRVVKYCAEENEKGRCPKRTPRDLAHARLTGVFLFARSPEGVLFWHRVTDFLAGCSLNLPPLPAPAAPAAPAQLSLAALEARVLAHEAIFSDLKKLLEKHEKSHQA
jgi:hypothetical protein